MAHDLVSSFESSVLLVRDVAGAYRPAQADEVLQAAQSLLWQQMLGREVLRSPQMVRPRGLSAISSGVQATYQAFLGNMMLVSLRGGRMCRAAGLYTGSLRIAVFAGGLCEKARFLYT